MKSCLLQLAALVLLAGGASAAPLDGPSERGRYSDSVAIKFGAGNFKWLESEAQRLIESKERFPDGTWKLPLFYAGLHPKKHLDKSAGPDVWMAAFESWNLAFPDSRTCLIAKADTLTSMAWDARGSGFANTVSQEQWKLFEERLKEARTLLESVPEEKRLDPKWYDVMQTVALGQSWDSKEYEALFARALALDPLYQEFYWSKAYYLLPRWHGEPGEWEKFAEESIRLAGSEGDAMYTRIAWSLDNFYEDFFVETRILWPKMRQGFEQIMSQYPGSRWNLNNYCHYAFLAGDRETVKRLTAQIGDDFHPNAWRTKAGYYRARRFGNGETDPEPRATFSRPDSGPAHAVSYAPDGKSLVACYQNGEVVIWDLVRGKPTAILPGDSPATAVKWSPDGSLIAAAYGGERGGPKGEVKVWQADSREEIARIGGWTSAVVTLAFRPDGKLLAMGGGKFGEKQIGELRLWDATTKESTSVEWATKHTHGLGALAFSPDGRLLAAECNRSITVWDVGEERIVHQAVQELQKWVQALAFSPDGKALAAATGGWTSGDGRKAGPVIYRLPSYDWKSPAFEFSTEDLSAIAWTADGNRLVAGGRDAFVYVWDQATAKVLHSSYTQSSRILDLALSPDSNTIAVAGEDGNVCLWPMP